MGKPASNLTRFFRNSDQLKSLEYHLLPDLIARRRAAGNKTLRIWVAGCSTGQEAYTIAIILRETLPEDIIFSIVGIDRSARAVEIASRGRYAQRDTVDVPPRFLGRYFDSVSEGFVIRPTIRQAVRFEQLPVESTDFGEEFDLVTCRNVLTYAEEPRRALLLDRIWSSMGPYSYLLIGASETLLGFDRRFEYLSDEWSSAYRKRC